MFSSASAAIGSSASGIGTLGEGMLAATSTTLHSTAVAAGDAPAAPGVATVGTRLCTIVSVGTPPLPPTVGEAGNPSMTRRRAAWPADPGEAPADAASVPGMRSFCWDKCASGERGHQSTPAGDAAAVALVAPAAASAAAARSARDERGCAAPAVGEDTATASAVAATATNAPARSDGFSLGAMVAARRAERLLKLTSPAAGRAVGAGDVALSPTATPGAADASLPLLLLLLWLRRCVDRLPRDFNLASSPPPPASRRRRMRRASPSITASVVEVEDGPAIDDGDREARVAWPPAATVDDAHEAAVGRGTGAAAAAGHSCGAGPDRRGCT